jgi:hypothetical protein
MSWTLNERTFVADEAFEPEEFTFTCAIHARFDAADIPSQPTVQYDGQITNTDVRNWLASLRSAVTEGQEVSFQPNSSLGFHVQIHPEPQGLAGVAIWFEWDRMMGVPLPEGGAPMFRGFRFTTTRDRMVSFILDITDEFNTHQRPPS